MSCPYKTKVVRSCISKEKAGCMTELQTIIWITKDQKGPGNEAKVVRIIFKLYKQLRRMNGFTVQIQLDVTKVLLGL